MNRKGFTLIELMAVIVILSVIALIATPIVLDLVGNVNIELSNEQEKIIERSAKMWGIKKLSVVSKNDVECPSVDFVSAFDLMNDGFLEKKDFKRLGTEDLANVGVCIDYSNNHFTYLYTNNVCECVPCEGVNDSEGSGADNMEDEELEGDSLSEDGNND